MRRRVRPVTNFISDPTTCDSAGDVGDVFVAQVGGASIEKRADGVLSVCQLYSHMSRDSDAGER